MDQIFFDDNTIKPDNWAQEMLVKYGWYVDFVFDDGEFPNSINIHTHGLGISFDHPDLQICFPLAQDTAHHILNDAVEMIRTGTRFEPGRKYGGIIGGELSVEFVSAKECGRKVLRLVFPNSAGTYEGEIFAAQFEKTLTDT